MNRLIYLDNAATTKPDPRVVEAMLETLSDGYANPSGSYSFSAKAKAKIHEAKRSCARLIGAQENNIFFTSGGTESDNWAIRETVRLCSEQGKSVHVITTAIEHHAILRTCEELEKAKGIRVTYVRPDRNGIVNISDIEAAITSDTVLISVMTANNEVGTVQNIKEIGKLAHEHGIYFHTDAVQAYGHIPVNVSEMGIDLLSASAHKLHAVKGVGLLYISSELLAKGFSSMIKGGDQENGLRAGTENVPGIVAFGKASQIAQEEMEEDDRRVKSLRDHFCTRILNEIPDCHLNGACDEARLAGNINIRFDNVQASSLLIELDMKGICCSTGSSCDAGSGAPSHVLLSLGLSETEAASSLRFSLSKFTTKDELDIAADCLKDAVQRLRAIRFI